MFSVETVLCLAFSSQWSRCSLLAVGCVATRMFQSVTHRNERAVMTHCMLLCNAAESVWAPVMNTLLGGLESVTNETRIQQLQRFTWTQVCSQSVSRFWIFDPGFCVYGLLHLISWFCFLVLMLFGDYLRLLSFLSVLSPCLFTRQCFLCSSSDCWSTLVVLHGPCSPFPAFVSLGFLF